MQPRKVATQGFFCQNVTGAKNSIPELKKSIPGAKPQKLFLLFFNLFLLSFNTE